MTGQRETALELLLNGIHNTCSCRKRKLGHPSKVLVVSDSRIVVIMLIAIKWMMKWMMLEHEPVTEGLLQLQLQRE